MIFGHMIKKIELFVRRRQFEFDLRTHVNVVNNETISGIPKSIEEARVVAMII